MRAIANRPLSRPSGSFARLDFKRPRGMLGTGMKLLPLLTVALVAIVSSAHAGSPSLLGTWTGTQTVSMLDRSAAGKVALVITAQDGPNFRGQMSWQAADGTKAAGSEKVAGVIDFDNKSVAIAQSKGGGIIWGTLKGANKLNIILVQATETPGSRTLAYRTTLTRAK